LYGTTSGGGTNGAGTVFKLNKDGAGYSVVRAFRGTGEEGQNPSAALVEGPDSALYGTTQAGGTNSAGTVFALDKNGSAFRVLHYFGAVPSDGTSPHAGLLQGTDGRLYGTTASGGAYFVGAAFKLNNDGSGYILLRSFSTTSGDGQHPLAGLVEGSDSVLYGTTLTGG